MAPDSRIMYLISAITKMHDYRPVTISFDRAGTISFDSHGAVQPADGQLSEDYTEHLHRGCTGGCVLWETDEVTGNYFAG